ncbi:MAG: hypothetical protein OXS35_02330 [Dehalococcoidia bacterium]|nr:hypothetical protein [Dehalococcoidia bacterium]
MTKPKVCWLCDEQLTETKEHIIPESMGGRKTVRGFICRDCNSKTGHDWDVAVAEFESWKFHLHDDLKINPQHGKPIRGIMPDKSMNVLIDSGVQIRLGFNPPVKTKLETGGVRYQFSCDPSRVDELFAAINTLLQRRGTDPITRDEFNARIRHTITPQPVVSFSLQLHIPKYFRSLVKTAMAMAFSAGINPMDCGRAVRYLCDETIGEEGVVAPPGTSLEGIIDDWTEYHAVTVFGFPDSQMLIGEVLYFGTVVGLVILSDSYDGPRIIAGHAISLRTGEYVDADLNLPNLILPEYRVLELARERVGRFKSPMVLQILRDLNRLAE